MSEVVQLPIVGMTCDHCVGTVRRALEGVPGVHSVAVDLGRGRAEIAVEPGPVDPARLRAAVEAAGSAVPERETRPRPRPMWRRSARCRRPGRTLTPALSQRERGKSLAPSPPGRGLG